MSFTRLWQCHFQSFGNIISKAWQCHFQTFSCERVLAGARFCGCEFLRVHVLAGARSCGRAFLRARVFASARALCKALEMTFPKLNVGNIISKAFYKSSCQRTRTTTTSFKVKSKKLITYVLAVKNVLVREVIKVQVKFE